MTDLTNKVDKLIKDDVGVVQEMVNKFGAVLQDHRPERDIPYIAYVIDTCVNHINEHHKDLPADIKAWAVLVIRNRHKSGKLKKSDDIPKLIDDFMTFWETEHADYCKDIIAVSEYDRDRGFVFRFEKKIGSR